MTAFLPGICAPSLKTPGRRANFLCGRRAIPSRQPARVYVSATTDEAPPLDGSPPTTNPPPTRPERPTAPQATPPRAFKPPPRPREQRESRDPREPRGYSSRPDRPMREGGISDGRSERSEGTGRLDRREGGGRFDRRDGGREERREMGRSERRESGRYERDERPPRPAFVPEPGVTYYTACGVCKASYVLDPTTLGPRGKRVGCAVCGNEWFQRGDKMLVLKETEGMKDYPLEEKDALIEAQRQARKTNFRSRRDEGEGRAGQYERREGGYERREGGHERREGGYDRMEGARDGGRRPSRSGYSPYSLFIGNLPFSVDVEELQELLTSKVEVKRLNIVKDPSGRSKGFAFADLSSDAAVQQAVDCFDGVELSGRALTVRTGRKN